MNARLSTLTALLTLALLTVQAHAVVLTFTGSNSFNVGGLNLSVVNYPQSQDPNLPVYGDHANGTFSDTVGPTTYTYTYGSQDGPTPNIGVSYGPGSSASATSPTNPFPVWYVGTSFDNPITPDVSNIIYQLQPSGIFNITLTADPTYQVHLHGFELAVFGGSTKLVDSLDVIVDGNDNNLITSSNVTGLDSFSFATPYVGSTIEIRLDTHTQPEWIGIGNVDFSQSTPEPASLGLLASGSLLLLRRKRR